MPLYEYQCRSCGNVSEVIQRMSDEPLSTCEECGGELKKLLSAPAFQFKGSGWYVTDYAGKSGGNGKGGSDDESSGKGDAKADSKSGSSGDSKSEAKASSGSSTSESKSKAEKVAS